MVASNSTSSSSLQSTHENSTDLTTNIGPKETAAAIIYYAAQSGVSDWKGVLNTSDGVTIKLSTDEDLLNSLASPGQGMAYLVYGYHDVDSDDETDFVYTIDKDDTVNIYTLPNDYDSDDTYSPIASISKADLVDYLNDHRQGNAVQSFKDKVIIDR